MSRRMAVNAGLLLAVLALALLVWFEPGLQEEERPRLTALEAGAVTDVSIHRGQAAEIRLERRDDAWMVTSPVSAWANEFRIEPLLRVVEAVSHARFPVAGQDLARYRLDPPLALLRVDGEEIAFGGTEALDHRRYVRVRDTVHLIDDFYYFRLQPDFPAFVSNSLLPPGSRPSAIRLPDLALRRDAQGRWMTSPEGALTPDEANRLAEEWGRAQALELDSYAEDDVPRAAIDIEFDAGRLTFELLEGGTGLVLGRPDLRLRYHLTDDHAQRLLGASSGQND